MGNKTKKKKFDTDSLSRSYRESVERSVGLKEPIVFKISSEAIKQRQKYWDQFFLKYSEEISDDAELDIETLKLYEPKIIYKSKSTIQHWVDTGYLPYQNSAYKNNCLRNNLPGVEREQDISYIRSYGDESSLSSSVDTAVYILSNINTTNKVETMAIVEGAKHNSSLNLWSTTHCNNTDTVLIANDKICDSNSRSNTENNNSSTHQQHSTTQVNSDKICDSNSRSNTENNNSNTHQQHSATQVNSDKICDSNTKNNINNDNSDNQQQHFPILAVSDKMNDSNAEHNISSNNNNNNNNNEHQPHSLISPETMTCMSQHQNTDPGKDTDTVHQTVNRDSPLSEKIRSYSFMLLNNLPTPMYSEQNCLEKSVVSNNTTKIKQRKKLYTSRDSPVDLVTMQQNSNQMLYKLNQIVHPALDVRYPLQKRLKKQKKKSIRPSCILNKQLINKFVPNHSKSDEIENSQNYFNKLVLRLNGLKEHDDTLHTNHNNEIENLNKCSSDQSVNTSLSSQSVNKNRKRTLRKSVSIKSRYNNNRKRSTAKMYNKFNNTFKKSKILNPVVRLTRLSDDVLKTCEKKTNKLIRIHKNLCPVVRLKRLSNSDIQKYKKSRDHSCKLKPVVYLKRLSEFEIQKYKRSTNTVKDESYLSPETSFKEPSEATVEKSTIIRDTETHNKINLLSETVQLPANNINTYEFPLKNAPNCAQSVLSVINVMSNDTDSDESTVLIYKCGQASSASNISLVSRNTQQSHFLTKEVCSNSNIITNKRNKNTILEKGVSNKQSTGETLNMPNSQKHTHHTSFLDTSRIMLQDRRNDILDTPRIMLQDRRNDILDTPRIMLQDRRNDNIHIISDQKVKLNIVVCSDTDSELEGSKRRSKRKKKENVSKKRNIKPRVCNRTENIVPEKRTMTRSATKPLEHVKDKVKKRHSKHIINYLHFETKLYESSSSDSDLLSSSS